MSKNAYLPFNINDLTDRRFDFSDWVCYNLPRNWERGYWNEDYWNWDYWNRKVRFKRHWKSRL